MLEMLVVFSNVQPQLQPYSAHALAAAKDKGRGIGIFALLHAIEWLELSPKISVVRSIVFSWLVCFQRNWRGRLSDCELRPHRLLTSPES